MKRSILVIFFVFLALKANAANVMLIAPFDTAFSKYAEEIYNGLSLSLGDVVNIVKVNSTGNVKKAIEMHKPEIIIGPFFNDNINRVLKYICNRQVYVFLPFSKDTDNCSNVFFLGYDPMQAVEEVAGDICNSNAQNIAVFYSYSKLNMSEKDAFLNDLSVCGKYASVVSGIPTFFNLMDQFVKETFGVEKIRKFSGLTEGKVFTYSLKPDATVVFAPSDVFAHFLDVLDYYDIDPGTVYTTDSLVDQNILSLSKRMLGFLRIVVPYYMCSDRPLALNFLRSYRQTYYEDPDQFAALGYDLGKVTLWILKNGSIKGFYDRNLLEGHFLFFDDKRRAVIDYYTLGYREIRRCRQQILSR